MAEENESNPISLHETPADGLMEVKEGYNARPIATARIPDPALSGSGNPGGGSQGTQQPSGQVGPSSGQGTK